MLSGSILAVFSRRTDAGIKFPEAQKTEGRPGIVCETVRTGAGVCERHPGGRCDDLIQDGKNRDNVSERQEDVKYDGFGKNASLFEGRRIEGTDKKNHGQ